MKRFILLIGFLCSTMLFANQAETYHATLKDNVFDVILASNASTGYKWKLNHYDKASISLVNQVYVPANSDKMGAPGKQVFTFKVLSQDDSLKSTQISFIYQRAWEKREGTIKKLNIVFDKCLCDK